MAFRYRVKAVDEPGVEIKVLRSFELNSDLFGYFVMQRDGRDNAMLVFKPFAVRRSAEIAVSWIGLTDGFWIAEKLRCRVVIQSNACT